MKFKGNALSKNLLIKKIAELTGKPAVYTGAPAFSYAIGDYRVCHDGTLEVDEDLAERNVITALIKENLIQPDAYVSPSKKPEVSEPTVETMTEEDEEELAKEKSHKIYEGSVVIKDRFIPVQTMINLINMIGSRGALISKSIGKMNAFWVSDNIIYDLPYEHPTTFEQLDHILKTSKGSLINGIEFTPKSVIFTGFPKTNDIVVRATYETLAEAMYRYCSGRKWVSSKRMEEPNEKYYFRLWLNHLGLGGPENKTYRKILMSNLDGNCSYRTKSQQIAHSYYESVKKEEKEKKKAIKAGNAQEGVAYE